MLQARHYSNRIPSNQPGRLRECFSPPDPATGWSLSPSHYNMQCRGQKSSPGKGDTDTGILKMSFSGWLGTFILCWAVLKWVWCIGHISQPRNCTGTLGLLREIKDLALRILLSISGIHITLDCSVNRFQRLLLPASQEAAHERFMGNARALTCSCWNGRP